MVLWSELCTLLILKQPDPYLALMCYKATPSAAMGVSPALLMAVKHMLEDKLQATPVDRHQIQQKDAQTKSAYQFFHALPELQSGQAVRVKLDGEKGWKISTKVIGKCNEPWFYIVKTDNSAVLWRNIKRLQAVPEPADHPDQQQLQPEELPVQLPCSPPSVAKPSHRDPVYVQKLKDPPVVCSPPQLSPHRAVQVTSRGWVVRVPLRYRDTWTLNDTHLHSVSHFLSNSVLRDISEKNNNITLWSLVKVMFHMNECYLLDKIW